MAAIELEITLEGDAPGLAAHRLSLAAFSKPLNLLLKAYRRIASGLLRDALHDPKYGGRGGKYAEAAKHLDFEIAQVGPGCLNLRLVCAADVDIGTSYPLFQNGLMEQAAATLLESIDAESKHILRNVTVRNFLAALPVGIRRQSYKIRRGGEELKSIVVGDIKLPEPPAAVPYLDEIEGVVVGVGFEPGPDEVRIQSADGAAITYAASGELVEKALELRHAAVRVVVVRGASPRLIMLRDAAETVPPVTHEQTVAHVMTRWDQVLRRLA